MLTQQFFSYIMERTSQFSMRWSGLLCTRPTCLVEFLKVLAHCNSSRIDMYWHIIPIPKKTVGSFFLMLSGEATKTNFIVFGLTWSGLKSTIYHTQTSTWTITPPMWLPLIELQIWQKCQSDFALISNVIVDQFRLNYKLNNRTRGPPGYHYMKIICLKFKN
jgi:hypothetical protein